MNLKNNPTLKSSKIKVGLTLGDPSGIGAAIILKALKILKRKVDLTVIGNSFVLAKAAKILKTKACPVRLVNLNNVKKNDFRFGKVSPESGQASVDYLDKALLLLKNKEIDCLVTCPVSKEAINLAGIKFSGHTEYLGDKTGAKDLVMMLLNDKLKFSLATRHIALCDVGKKLTRETLENNILKTTQGLKSFFSIKKPRIVVCGVNPHASDNGVIGTEEQKIIIPAIKSLKKKLKNLVLTGPLSADIAISSAASGKFDCVIVAYHDQALIPLKLTGFDSGVNLTLGLSFVRTSPLHGTAFDIAARPALANPASLIAAIRLAIKCTLNQKKA